MNKEEITEQDTDKGCCEACEAIHGNHTWCKKPNCPCHQAPTPSLSEGEEAYRDGYEQGKFDAEITAEYGEPSARSGEIKLLPCPFCGGKANIDRYGDSSKSTQYSCEECGASLETNEEFDHGGSWNERTLLSQTLSNEREMIICSAVKFGDRVWRGHRHGDAINAMHGELSYTMNRKQMNEAQTDKEQGFITSKNRYVGREEAWEIADKAGQIIERDYQKKGYLFSEDLW